MCFVEMTNREETLKAYNALQKIDPATAGKLYEQMNQPSLKETDPQVLILYASDVLRELEDDREALRAYRRAIALKPEPFFLSMAHEGIGRFYIKRKQYEKALAPLREALRLQPDNSEAHWKLGLAYRGLQQYPNAAAALQQAIRLQPEYVDARFDLGMTYLEMGKKQDALQVYRTLQTINKEAAQKLLIEIDKTK